ncbi:MFS transporter [Herbidospora sp. NBRC 101105]|uniref:MFS transporter n=1 Tax=Herbidospora sp. NBRC 101105 TaxID=3032195 RepID=UPI0024A388F1|nr:MFS transporter [Herbidospora sp. NBRC 101105]GLX94029.1 MFS transporter [Herbidospora sp. NBRC 101105]
MNPRQRVTLLVIALAQLMLILDGTIVTVALPGIQEELGFSPGGLSWVMNAYMLAFGGLLLLGGRAGDILGRRRALTAGVLIFTLASLLGGFAPGPEAMIASRVLQGVGGALAGPAGLALITGNFPQGPLRDRAIAVFTSVGAAGAAIGLLAGGVLTDLVSWRWVMFVNVPIGLAILALTPVFVRETDRVPGRFDLAGAVTATTGSSGLVYGLVRASEQGWDDGWALASLLGGVLLLTLFVQVERRAAQPVMPLGLFAERSRVAGYAAMLLLPAAMMGTFFFLTQFVQLELGYSPMQAGLAFLPLALTILALSQLAGRILRVVRPHTAAVAGMLLIPVGLVWLSRIDATTSYFPGVFVPLVIMGVGAAAALVVMSMRIINGVRGDDAGAASGLLQAMQQMGGSLGLAVLVTVHASAGLTATFLTAAGFSLLSLLVVTVLRPRQTMPEPENAATAVTRR